MAPWRVNFFFFPSCCFYFSVFAWAVGRFLSFILKMRLSVFFETLVMSYTFSNLLFLFW